jgi:hypothetical protein
VRNPRSSIRGLGDIDYWKASYWKDFVGVTVRTYDSKTGLWRINWVDNTFSGGIIQPPVVGKFDGNVGIFEGPDTFRGIPIIVRYTQPAGSLWIIDLPLCERQDSTSCHFV